MQSELTRQLLGHRLKRMVTRPFRAAQMAYSLIRVRNATEYASPTDEELRSIELSLNRLGVTVKPLRLDPQRFTNFKTRFPFPRDYHGGPDGGVWDEKLLEHFLAFERLGLDAFRETDIYLDVAACESPWALMLRDELATQAYAIDLEVGPLYRHLPYYTQEDATSTSFGDNEVRAASLQCAFEMFRGDDDVGLIREFARILAKGGRAIISPLYMHTHYCGYSTAEYFDRGYDEPGATPYVRRGFRGVPFSRKYDAAMLKSRILDTIVGEGLSYRLLKLENKNELGSNIYCHFILEIMK